MNKVTSYIMIALFAASCFLAGRLSIERSLSKSGNTAIATDTVVFRDTTYVGNPAPIDVIILDETIDIAMDDVVKFDNDSLALPLETKIYKGDNYEAQVSGYRPTIDFLKLYPETRYVTRTVTDARYNSISVSVGMIYSGKTEIPAMVTFEHRFKHFSLEAGVGYDFAGGNPLLAGRLRIPIYSW